MTLGVDTVLLPHRRCIGANFRGVRSWAEESAAGEQYRRQVCRAQRGEWQC